MPYVKDNRTHYSTEDIEAAVTALVKDIKRKSKGWKYTKEAQTEFGIRYWQGPATWRYQEPEDPPMYVGEYNTRLSPNVKILKKKDVDALQDPLTLLAAAGDDEIRLPDAAVAQIMAMGAYHLGIRRKGSSGFGKHRRRRRGDDDGFQRLVKRAQVVVEDKGLFVRVMPKLAEPRVRRARTPEERIEYWKKVYTTGRRARKLDWRKKNDLLPAVRQYELAWRETLPQLARAKAAGAEIEHHPSPAELLRDLADQWEAEERV
jgi:hypothetical protein